MSMNNFTCCKLKQIPLYYICTKCSGTFHKSCVQRDKKKYKFLKDYKIVCYNCYETDETDRFGEEERSFLEKTITDLTDDSEAKDKRIESLKTENLRITQEALEMEEELNNVIKNQERIIREREYTEREHLQKIKESDDEIVKLKYEITNLKEQKESLQDGVQNYEQTIKKKDVINSQSQTKISTKAISTQTYIQTQNLCTQTLTSTVDDFLIDPSTCDKENNYMNKIIELDDRIARINAEKEEAEHRNVINKEMMNRLSKEMQEINEVNRSMIISIQTLEAENVFHQREIKSLEEQLQQSLALQSGVENKEPAKKDCPNFVKNDQPSSAKKKINF